MRTGLIAGPDIRDIRRSRQSSAHGHRHQVRRSRVSTIARCGKIPGFGYGAATRLLSLARPDRLVSVNRGSKNRIKGYFGRTLDITDGERFADRYTEFLRWLHSHAWFNHEPSTGFEREIWSCRAALLDAYFYTGLND